jgi:hypothetical protein
MVKAWAAVVVWFQGKKTILGGVLVIAAGVAGVWYGKLDPVNGLTVVGIGVSIAGYSAKVNRHQAQLLAALQDVSRAAADSKLGSAAVIGDLVPGAIGLASAAAPALLAGAGATLHISAATAAEVQTLIASLVPSTTVMHFNAASPSSTDSPARSIATADASGGMTK